jgi:hypothetical protein
MIHFDSELQGAITAPLRLAAFPPDPTAPSDDRGQAHPEAEEWSMSSAEPTATII